MCVWGVCSLVAPPLDVPVIIITIKLFVCQFIVCCTAGCFATNVDADYKNFVFAGHVILGHTFTTEHIFKSFAIGIRGQNSFYGFYSPCTSQWSQDGLVSIVTRLWARCPKEFWFNSWQEQELCFYSKGSRLAVGPT